MSTDEVPYEIVRPTLSDIEVLVALWQQLVQDQQRYGTRIRAEANADPAQSWFGTRMTYDAVRVAKIDGEIVGFVTFERLQDQFNRTARDGVIHNLYVIPSSRGHGIGSALLNRAEELLFERGVDRVTLEVLEGNRAAQEFYEARAYDLHRRTYAKAFDQTDTDIAKDPEP